MDDELSWLFTNRLSNMGLTEILGGIWLFSANKIKSSESFRKQPTQLIVVLNSSLQHIIVTKVVNQNRNMKTVLRLQILLKQNIRNSKANKNMK